MMKISIDESLCSGHGRCYVLAPDVFATDDAGYGSVKLDEVPPELEEQARAAERNCPERAIVISD